MEASRSQCTEAAQTAVCVCVWCGVCGMCVCVCEVWGVRVITYTS